LEVKRSGRVTGADRGERNYIGPEGGGGKTRNKKRPPWIVVLKKRLYGDGSHISLVINVFV